MTYKNKILQKYAEEIANEYELLLTNHSSYNAVLLICQKYNLTRFQAYRYIKNGGAKIKTEMRKLNKNGKFAKITDHILPIDN